MSIFVIDTGLLSYTRSLLEILFATLSLPSLFLLFSFSLNHRALTRAIFPPFFPLSLTRLPIRDDDLTFSYSLLRSPFSCYFFRRGQYKSLRIMLHAIRRPSNNTQAIFRFVRPFVRSRNPQLPFVSIEPPFRTISTCPAALTYTILLLSLSLSLFYSTPFLSLFFFSSFSLSSFLLQKVLAARVYPYLSDCGTLLPSFGFRFWANFLDPVPFV